MHTSRRSTRRSARRCSSVAGALLALALVATACGGDAPGAPSPAPEPTPGVEDTRPDVADVDLAGVRIVDGWTPYGVFADDFSPWVDGVAMDVAGWLDHVPPTRTSPAGAVVLDVDVVVELDPAPCFAFARSLSAVRVGLAGAGVAGAADAAAAAAIEERLLVAVQAGVALLDDHREPSAEDRARCEGHEGPGPVGFHLVEVHAEACALPDGTGVVCATVGTFGNHLGARESWSGDTHVFDAATGERLDAAAPLAPYDPRLLTELFDRIRLEVPISVPGLIGNVEAFDLDLTPMNVDADVVPSVEGMVWRWSPYLHALGSLDVVVPWDVLEAARAR